jgi:Uma2 family endonuclease
MVDQDKTRITATEFFQLVADSDERMELINGEVIVMPTPIPEHQDRVLQTAFVIKGLTKEGKVYVAPLEVYLDEDNVPQPDVIWLAPNSRCVIGEKRLEGAPDLIVEVSSPGTAKYDKDDKFKLYERFGVCEYWIVDTERRFIEVWQLVEERFRLQGVFGREETFKSLVLNNQTVNVATIFES